MLKKRSLILVKEESEYASDSSPSASDNALLGIDVKTKEAPEAEEREVEKGYLGRRASLLGKIHTEITFQVELKGSGTKGTAARIGDLLEACGFTETVVAGSSVNYAPGSSSLKSVTIYHFIDGRKHIITGARGSIKLVMAAGKRAFLEFTMKGLYTAPTDTALPAASYETTVPPVCKSCALSLNSVSNLVVQQVEIDMAIAVALRESLNAATGVAGFEIESRKPTISLNPEAVSVATYDFRTDLLTTPRSFSMVIGSVAGNIITITAPKLNITEFEYADREGVLVENIKGELAENSGNDEIAISFT